MIAKIRNVYLRRATLVAVTPAIWIIYTACAAWSAAGLTLEDVRDAW